MVEPLRVLPGECFGDELVRVFRFGLRLKSEVYDGVFLVILEAEPVPTRWYLVTFPTLPAMVLVPLVNVVRTPFAMYDQARDDDERRQAVSDDI